jgi:hypothetical protein
LIWGEVKFGLKEYKLSIIRLWEDGATLRIKGLRIMAIVVAIQMSQAMLTYQSMWAGRVALTITKVVRELQWVQIGMQAVISILVKELVRPEMIMTMGRTKATKDSKEAIIIPTITIEVDTKATIGTIRVATKGIITMQTTIPIPMPTLATEAGIKATPTLEPEAGTKAIISTRITIAALTEVGIRTRPLTITKTRPRITTQILILAAIPSRAPIHRPLTPRIPKIPTSNPATTKVPKILTNSPKIHTINKTHTTNPSP